MRFLLWSVTLILLVGCSSKVQWETTNVAGILPDLQFTLQNTDGQKVTQADMRGKVTALFFGYTSCPDVCPITMSDLRQAIGKLDKPLQNKIQILFVSVDPKRDTPAKLAAYTHVFGPQFIGLTSDIPSLRKLAQRYHGTFSYGKPNATGFYVVSHPVGIYVFNAKGKARLLMQENQDSVDAMSHDLGQLIQMQ